LQQQEQQQAKLWSSQLEERKLKCWSIDNRRGGRRGRGGEGVRDVVEEEKD
jgi:hypothetical protein